MKWAYLSVDGEMGVDEGLVCAGCSDIIHDLAYFPTDWDNPEGEALARAVRSDKLYMESDFPASYVFCEDCKNGLITYPSLKERRHWPRQW